MLDCTSSAEEMEAASKEELEEMMENEMQARLSNLNEIKRRQTLSKTRHNVVIFTMVICM